MTKTELDALKDKIAEIYTDEYLPRHAIKMNHKYDALKDSAEVYRGFLVKFEALLNIEPEDLIN